MKIKLLIFLILVASKNSFADPVENNFYCLSELDDTKGVMKIGSYSLGDTPNINDKDIEKGCSLDLRDCAFRKNNVLYFVENGKIVRAETKNPKNFKYNQKEILGHKESAISFLKKMKNISTYFDALPLGEVEGRLVLGGNYCIKDKYGSYYSLFLIFNNYFDVDTIGVMYEPN